MGHINKALDLHARFEHGLVLVVLAVRQYHVTAWGFFSAAALVIAPLTHCDQTHCGTQLVVYTTSLDRATLSESPAPRGL